MRSSSLLESPHVPGGDPRTRAAVLGKQRYGRGELPGEARKDGAGEGLFDPHDSAFLVQRPRRRLVFGCESPYVSTTIKLHADVKMKHSSGLRRGANSNVSQTIIIIKKNNKVLKIHIWSFRYRYACIKIYKYNKMGLQLAMTATDARELYIEKVTGPTSASPPRKFAPETGLERERERKKV